MKAVADQNMTDLPDTFGRHLDLRLRPGRSLSREDIGDAEVLLVRSVTRVDADLLSGSRVRFVGTATIGTDHLDTKWLESQGITWASAPGCNADAAAQYTLGMIMLSGQRLGRKLADQRVAIVGHGNVGSRLHRLLTTLGAAVTVYDPPLQETGGLAGLEPGVRVDRLDDALAADIVSLHVPFTRSGPWATAGMIGAEQLAGLADGALLVNTARGGVVDGMALREALGTGRIHAALDVWPEEPLIDPALLDLVTVATPHVAGFSVEGKQRGTRMIFDAFLRWSGGTPSPDASGPITSTGPTGDPRLRLPPGLDDPLTAVLVGATKVEADDTRLRRTGVIDAGSFDRVRRAHAPRHEFSRVKLTVPGRPDPRFEALGFRLEAG